MSLMHAATVLKTSFCNIPDVFELL